MPLRTETYTLADEVERIEGELTDLGEEAAGYEPDTPHFERAESTAQQLYFHLEGLQWALDEWDVETVELGALSAGEYALMDKHISDSSSQQQRRNVFVGVATVDAPYVGETPQATVEAVADTCHPYYTRWAESRANKLLRGDSGNTNPFYESLAENQD